MTSHVLSKVDEHQWWCLSAFPLSLWMNIINPYRKKLKLLILILECVNIKVVAIGKLFLAPVVWRDQGQSLQGSGWVFRPLLHARRVRPLDPLWSGLERPVGITQIRRYNVHLNTRLNLDFISKLTLQLHWFLHRATLTGSFVGFWECF